MLSISRLQRHSPKSDYLVLQRQIELNILGLFVWTFHWWNHVGILLFEDYRKLFGIKQFEKNGTYKVLPHSLPVKMNVFHLRLVSPKCLVKIIFRFIWILNCLYILRVITRIGLVLWRLWYFGFMGYVLRVIWRTPGKSWRCF